MSTTTHPNLAHGLRWLAENMPLLESVDVISAAATPFSVTIQTDTIDDAHDAAELLYTALGPIDRATPYSYRGNVLVSYLFDSRDGFPVRVVASEERVPS